MRETSLNAFESMKDRILPLKEQVLILIKKKNGLTCWEIENLLSLSHQTASARINDLIKENLIKESGFYRKTQSGRNAIVWIT